MMPGVTFEEITSQLTDAYLQPELETVLRNRMSVRLDRIVGPGTFDYVVFQLLRWAEMNGREVELVQVTAKAKPLHSGMQSVYQKYGMAVSVLLQRGGVPLQLAAQPVTGSAFEAQVKKHLPFLEVGLWRKQLTALEGRVCRVEVGNGKMGSGFLVGPDAVLTNYHVLEAVLTGTSPADAVWLRFDFKKLANGTDADGRVVKLHPTEWRIDDSPYTQSELNGAPDAQLPGADELDYALVRLERPLGSEPVDANPKPGEKVPVRGWVRVPAAEPAIAAPMSILILQHPNREPMKLAMDTEGVIGLNGNSTRVRYATNTEGGSSGSPVFDLKWNLIALHQYGDPEFNQAHYNQGVPIGRIRERLGKNKKEGALGGEIP